MVTLGHAYYVAPPVSTIYTTYFHDRSVDSWGLDDINGDNFDITMLLTHGGERDGLYTAKMTDEVIEQSEYVCTAIQDKMIYGDKAGQTYTGKMEILILPACGGLSYCNEIWNYSENLHAVHAYTGVSRTGYEFDTTVMIPYANEGYGPLSAAESWIDNAYYSTGGPSWNCPVVITGASTVAIAQDYLYFETFDVFAGDSPGSQWVRLKYSNCDPGFAGPEGGLPFNQTFCGIILPLSTADAGTSAFSSTSSNGLGKVEVAARLSDAISLLDNNANMFEETSIGSKKLSYETLRSSMGFVCENAIPSMSETYMSRSSEVLANDSTCVDLMDIGDESYLQQGRMWMQDNEIQRVRFAHLKTRHFGNGNLPSRNDSIQFAKTIASRLGISEEEIAEVVYDNISEDAYDGESKTWGEDKVIYNVVTLKRRIGTVPVENSYIRIVQGANGVVERMAIQWPSGSVLEANSAKEMKRNVEKATLNARDQGQVVDILSSYQFDPERRRFIPTVTTYLQDYIEDGMVMPQDPIVVQLAKGQ